MEVLRTSQAAELGRVGSVSLGYLPGEKETRGQVVGLAGWECKSESPPGVEEPEEFPGDVQRTHRLWCWVELLRRI